MTLHLDPDRILEDWLAEGPSQLPDPAIEDIVRLVDETDQRKRTWLPGSIAMNRIYLSLGAAAVGVAVLLAALYVAQNDPSGGSTGGGVPSPTPQATASATPPPLRGTTLEAGTYRVTSEVPVPVHITVPDGWSNVGGWAILKDTEDEFVAGLSFWSPTQAASVYAHPCSWQDETPTLLDQTPAAVAEALAAQPLRGDAAPQAVTLDGYPGLSILLTIPSDLDFSECDGGEPYSWVGRAHQVPGQYDNVLLIDVDGALLVIDASYAPDAPRDVMTELGEIVESIAIE
jgi:hypothetical protein